MASIGFPVPPQQTITDWMLHVVDKRFKRAKVDQPKRRLLAPAANEDGMPAEEVDFADTFDKSEYAAQLRARIDEAAAVFNQESSNPPRCQQAISAASSSRLDSPRYLTSWWTQFTVLVHRFLLQARRDLTLYVLQSILCLGFGFVVGAEFWQLPHRVGSRLQDVSNGLVWLVFIAAYLQVFKVYYLMENKKRFHDEHSNQSYAVSAFALANLVVTVVCSFLTFMPGLLVGYFMMGMPSASVGYAILMLLTTVLAAESLMDLTCQFTVRTPSAILLGQGTLVVLCVFAGGAFIEWSRLGFWLWLSECSLFTWSTRGLMMHIARHLSYSCPTEYLVTDGATATCQFNGLVFPIDSTSPVDDARISGRTVLSVAKNLTADNPWLQWGILLLLAGLFRIATYLLMRLPIPRIIARLRAAIRATVRRDSSDASSTNKLALAHAQTNKEKTPTDHQEQLPSRGGVKIDVTVSLPSTRARSFHSSGCILHWKKLSMTLRGSGKTLVEPLDGEAAPGRLLAIMGPSGAGKTTLLNALSGRAPYARIHGSVQLGSSPLSKNHLDFVPQFDALNPMHTVAHSLCIMARLKNCTDDECEPRVAELLELLGLTDMAYKLVGQLSSGDRKRVSIGLALISNPSVLFLDEPTTGLDSESSLVVCEYLHRVTRSTGVVCVLTIHQPSAAIFNLMDDLLLMARGQMAYFGEATNASRYFAQQGMPVPDNINPADYYLDLMNDAATTETVAAAEGAAEVVVVEAKEHIAADDEPNRATGRSKSRQCPEWRQLLDASEFRYQPQSHGRTPAPDPERPSEWARLLVLTSSRMLYFWNERSLYLLRMLELLLLAIFIGTLFLRVGHSLVHVSEIAGALFFCVWVLLFAAISATPVFVRDRLVCDNEYLNGAYSLHVHVLAQLLAALPYQIASAVLFQSVAWFMVGFHDSAQAYFYSVLMSLSLLLLMEGVSLLLVHFIPDAMLATTSSMVVLGMLFLFNGFFVRVADTVKAISWIAWIMPTKYTLDGLLNTILHGQSFDTGMPQQPQIDGVSVAVDFFKLDQRPIWGDYAIVLVFALVMRLVHWAVLHMHYRNAQQHLLAEDDSSSSASAQKP